MAPTQVLAPAPASVEMRLSNEAMPHLAKHITQNAKRRFPTVPTQRIGEGKTVAICGSGPSLADNIADYAHQVDELWGCNHSLLWLRQQGYRPTHAITVDPTKGMLADWDPYPDVQYYVASIAHPKLLKELQRKGRRVQVFHTLAGVQAPKGWASAAHGGLDYETWLYKKHYRDTWRVDHGLNTANRATCLALVLGFEKVYVLGADCAVKASDDLMPPDGAPAEEVEAWLKQQQLYAWDHAPTLWGRPAMLEGVIEGRRWVTRIDLAISAHCFYVMKHTVGDKLELVGDTLPNAIMHLPEDQVKASFPTSNGTGGVTNMALRGERI